MTAITTLFSRAGATLFVGTDEWRPLLAERLDVDPRNVQRWASGEREVPSGVWRDLRALLDARRREIDAVVDEIESNRGETS